MNGIHTSAAGPRLRGGTSQPTPTIGTPRGGLVFSPHAGERKPRLLAGAAGGALLLLGVCAGRFAGAGGLGAKLPVAVRKGLSHPFLCHHSSSPAGSGDQVFWIPISTPNRSRFRSHNHCHRAAAAASKCERPAFFRSGD